MKALLIILLAMSAVSTFANMAEKKTSCEQIAGKKVVEKIEEEVVPLKKVTQNSGVGSDKITVTQ